jgi:hypothetical protein
MKPSERFEPYLIWGLTILLALFAFLPRYLLPQWATDYPGLLFFCWFMLAFLCLGAISVVRDWAKRRNNKWLLAFGIPPLAILIYEVSYSTKMLALGVIREWRGFLVFSWIALTIYLWSRGNDYKKRAEWADGVLMAKSANEELRPPDRCPHCGARL